MTLLAALLLVAGVSQPMAAQANYGSIVGAVTDPTGAGERTPS